MSSLELLEFCDHMPERGALKTAQRDGDWCEEQAAIFQAANELAVLRASQVENVESEQWGSRMFLSPKMIRDMQEEAAERGEAREAVYAMATRK